MQNHATKQWIKNAGYRAVGEVASRLRRRARPSLRVLLYHKVNDLEANPGSVPVDLFRQHVAALDGLGYRPVGLDDVLCHLSTGAPLPERAVLITFDDGYLDNLLNAAPILDERGYESVVFVPVGYVGLARLLPHDRQRDASNPILDWEGVRAAESLGMRAESHGVDHVPLASLPDDEARRQLVDSKRILEENLGRRIDAYAYVKGSRADFGPRHVAMLREAGYRAAFTTLTGTNAIGEIDALRIRRYNIEPYSVRTLELVLAGACDSIAAKDSVAGSAVKGAVNRRLGTGSR